MNSVGESLSVDLAGDETWLAERGVLLHIGPPKTGTTALQSSLFAARAQLKQQGFRYPIRKENGRRSTQHGYASAALMGLRRQGTDSVESLDVWDNFVQKVDSRPNRALLSAELFSDSRPDHIEKIVTDLGPDDLQVLVTLRPLSSLLASTWQQDLKGGRPQAYNDWLTERLGGSRDTTFWYRHSHDQLVERWVSQLGADRVAVLVVDSSQPEMLLDNFEALSGIEGGTLAPKKGNRSLTVAETELFRQVLQRLDDDFDPIAFHRLVRAGGLRSMVERRQPEADEPRLSTPVWALNKAHEIHKPMVDHIVRMGIPIFGDLSVLTDPPEQKTTPAFAETVTDEDAPTSIPIDAAAEMALGIYRAAGRDQKLREEESTSPKPPEKAGLRTRLTKSLARKKQK